MPEHSRSPSPPIVAIAGWILPGLGYWLLGQRARALTIGITVLALFFLGILVAGVRVIDVPGYDEQGQRMQVRTGSRPGDEEWILTAKPLSEIANKPWYVAQILAGPANILCSLWSIDAANPDRHNPPYPKVKARLGEIGTLYTAVAGMLNLLAIIDAAHRASHQT